MENRSKYSYKTPSPNNKQVMFNTTQSRVGVPSSDGPHRRSLSSKQSPPSIPYTARFEVGAFYLIDHKQLLPRSPIHLKFIRVVKVFEETSFCVTVSFPSYLSLTNFFSRLRLRSANSQAVQEPEMDERYVMSSNQATKILRKKVPLSVFYKESSMDNFWLLNPVDPGHPPSTDKSSKNACYKLVPGSCLLTLRRHADLKWGLRKTVKYVAAHNCLPEEEGEDEDEMIDHNANISESNMVPDLMVPEVNKQEETEEQKKAAVRVKTEMVLGNRKKRKMETGSGPRTKRMKRREKEKKKIKRREKQKKKQPAVQAGGKNPEFRWSTHRYKTAEKSLLQVMKQIGAKPGKPVLRNNLREEARQFIGDTGLLDHLLKHMAGKVLSDGADRFVRRHNYEGSIEYWLEPAELAEIRCQAGITDQLWLPPPGWKPGDPVGKCTCCHQCQLALQLGTGHQLKEEILANVKREMEEQSVKLMSEQNEKMQALLQIQPVDHSWKEKYESLLIQNTKLQEQITALSVSLLSVKDEMRAMKEDKEKQQLLASNNTFMNNNNNINTNALMVKENGKQQVGVSSSTSEGRRSGFRICKPEGTFLWPNMAAPSNSFSNNTNNYNNYLNNGCPTPPSATSSATSPSKFLLLPSPTSLHSPVTFSGPGQFNNTNNVMGRRERGCDEMVLGTAPETDSEGDVLTDLALTTLSF